MPFYIIAPGFFFLTMNVAGMNMLSLPHLRNVISSHTENGSPRGACSFMSQCVPPGLRQRECRFPSSLGLRGTWVIKMCLQKNKVLLMKSQTPEQ